jgi:hypothetical protein
MTVMKGHDMTLSISCSSLTQQSGSPHAGLLQLLRIISKALSLSMLLMSCADMNNFCPIVSHLLR